MPARFGSLGHDHVRAGGGRLPGAGDILHLADQPGSGLPDQGGDRAGSPKDKNTAAGW